MTTKGKYYWNKSRPRRPMTPSSTGQSTGRHGSKHYSVRNVDEYKDNDAGAAHLVNWLIRPR